MRQALVHVGARDSYPEQDYSRSLAADPGDAGSNCGPVALETDPVT